MCAHKARDVPCRRTERFMLIQSRVMRMADVCRRVALSRSQVYRLEAAGLFPTRLKIGRRASAWLESEVERWISERAAARFAGGEPRR